MSFNTGKSLCFCILLSLIFTTKINAQDSLANKGQLTFSGFVDIYYSDNLNNPASKTFPGFFYNYNNDNHIAVNLALLRANYTNDRMHMNVGLMTGTYAGANLAAEPALFQNIYEANVGIKLSKKHNLWFDGGVLTSHIGFESAISKDCWTLTRSVAAENSPYYHTGAEITYTSPKEKFVASLLYLNGWQRMQRPPANSTPAGGWQIIYKPNDKLTLNSCSFVGNDKPDSIAQIRLFHHFNLLWQPTKKFGLIFGFDYGMEQKPVDSLNKQSGFNSWYSPVVIARYFITDAFAIAARFENYSDPKHVIVTHLASEGSGITGVSLNTDFYFSPNALLRFEYKMFMNDKKVFEQGKNKYSTSNGIFSVSLSGYF